MNQKLLAVIIVVIVVATVVPVAVLLGTQPGDKDKDKDKDKNGTPGPLSYINVTPPEATLKAGDTLRFTARGYDHLDREMNITPIWKTGDGGTIDQNGTFLAKKVGVWGLTSTAEAITGEATVTVTPGPISEVLVSPLEVGLRAGGSIVMKAVLYDAFGNVVNGSVEWSTTGGGPIDANGTFEATTVGSWMVSANADGKVGTCNVTVNEGELASVTVEPGSVTLAAGQSVDFNASGTDAYGNEVALTPTWTATGGGLIAPDGDGTYSARTTGSWEVVATVGNVSGNANVTVVPGPLVEIQVTPSNSELVAGDSETFRAKGADAFGNIVNITPVWDVLGGGTIEVVAGDAVFSARTVGVWTIWANASGGISGSASINILPASPARVEITPDNVTLIMGESATFTSQVFDAYDNQVPTTTVWDVNGGGVIDQEGTFDVDIAGIWTVYANVTGASGNATVHAKPIQRGDRILSLDINEAEGLDYDGAVDEAMRTGTGTTTLSLPWDLLEPQPGVYNGTLLDIADVYYPAKGLNISLTVGPIDTNNNRMPSDIASLPFDDPSVIARFRDLLNFTFDRIQNVSLVSIALGNEVDILIGTNSVVWAQYTTFLEAAMDHVRTLRPGVPLGAKVTFEGLTGASKNDVILLNAETDVIMVTYYPLEGGMVKDPASVADDFDLMTSIYPYREFYILECGYPSGSVVGSSEDMQADFIRNVFWAWDNHTGQIRLINFVWLHDISQEILDEYEQYYGSSDPKFLDFLATLGLRTYGGTGTDKLAYLALVEEAKARGW